jgi:hypothetical protein
MPLVDDLKPLKLMRPMLVPEHCTVTADCPLASVAVVIHRGVIVKLAHLLRLRLLSLQCVDGGCHLLHESAVHQLVDPKGCAAMRALLPLLDQPFLLESLS